MNISSTDPFLSFLFKRSILIGDMVKTLLLCVFFFVMFLSSGHTNSIEKSGSIEAFHQGKRIEFPLLKSDYQVNIQGDLATVRLEQWFKNPTTEPLDASYLFPLNKDSAVYAMNMRIGDKQIEAKIKRREQAEAIFNQAKQDGKAASLLTQHRPNMFTQQLTNLMPDTSIRVTLQYTQHVPRIDQQYELVLPLVVGPRYIPTNQVQPDIQNKTHSEQVFNQWELQEHPDYPPVFGIDTPKELASDRVKITVRIDAAMPIHSISSQTHPITTTAEDNQHKKVTLAAGRVIDNSDFVLHYKLGGKAVQAGLLTHQDERGEFFSLLIEPPALPQADQITPREMVFVLDTSGSMDGQPLTASQVFMRQAVKHLRSNDFFRIIDFGNSPREYSATALPATTENVYRGIQHINQLSAGGGTEIVAAIEQAFKPKKTENTLRIVVFLTDGYIGNEADVLSKIHQLRGDARIYALGVGSSVNRYLLDEMAQAGRGFVRYIDPYQTGENITEAAIQFANRLQTPVMTNLKIDWGDMQVSAITPAVLPDLFVGDSLRVLGKFKPATTTETNPVKQSITLSGYINGKTARLRLSPDALQQNARTEAIPLIWARSQIKERMRAFQLPGYARAKHLPDDNTIKQQVTELGLTYSLMTKWTSFVAVTKEIVNPNAGNNTSTQVPLPMPKGVSKLAYATPSHAITTQFAGSSTPEPSPLWALIIMGLIGAFALVRKTLIC